MLATLISTGALKRRAKKALKGMDARLDAIRELVEELDSKQPLALPAKELPDMEAPRVIVR